MPAGLGCTQIEGWGDFRMRCGDAEIAFSGEEVGWQVVVHGALSSPAETLIERITQQVSRACGVPCEWIRIA
jgi:hypothetical protein